MNKAQGENSEFHSVRMSNVDASMFDGQKILPLNESDEKWLADRNAEGRRLVIHYRLNAEGRFTVPMLDQLLVCWRNDSSKTRVSEDQFAEAVGALFGHVLTKALNGEYVVVSDQCGTALGVQSRPGEIGYPIDAVKKRLDRPDATLSELFAFIMHHHQSNGVERK